MSTKLVIFCQDDMGAYMCIAKNTVPPAQSKRVFVYVQCA